MEKAAGARCELSAVVETAPAFLAACGVPYVQGKALNVSTAPLRSTIDTGFFVDHAEADALRAAIPDWHLGPLGEGEEVLGLAARPII